MSVSFRDFVQQVVPIKMSEPLAKTLGAFASDEMEKTLTTRTQGDI